MKKQENSNQDSVFCFFKNDGEDINYKLEKAFTQYIKEDINSNEKVDNFMNES